MRFCVLIPARLASTRLPDKPLADIAGQPMVVRVAQRASASAAQRVVVAADSARIVQACEAHGVEAVLTRTDHASGSDRLAEACELLGLADADLVVNVQGDEPLIDPSLIDSVAALLRSPARSRMSTAAHPIDSVAEFTNPNVVKVGARRAGLGAVLQPRAAPVVARRLCRQASTALPQPRPLRHVGIYGYRADFLREFPRLAQAPIEAGRGAGAAARAVARPPHRRPCDGHRAGRRRRHARGPGAGARPLAQRTSPKRAPEGRMLSFAPMMRNGQGALDVQPAAPADFYIRDSEDIHETDFVGRARRRQRHASCVHLPEVRHPANLHRRHAARSRQGRHAAGPGGQESHGFGRAGQRRHHHRPGQGAHRAARLRQRLPVRRFSPHHSAGRCA